jgi:hypothetical protein
MSLLHLPLELVRQILQEAVTSLGPCCSLRLRLVSRVFNKETLRAYEKAELLKAIGTRFTPEYQQDYDSRVEFIAAYLLERPHLTCLNFSTIANDVVDELIQLNSLASAEELRIQYMKALCRSQPLSLIYRMIFHKENNVTSSCDNHDNVIVAAIWVGAYPAIQHILDENHTIVKDVASDMLGTPLYAAFRTKQLDITRDLL